MYHNSDQLLREVESRMDGIPNATLFVDPQYDKLLESWCAAMFGVGYSKLVSPCTVAVNDSNERLDVDFFVKSPPNTWEFQLAEAQELTPRRRRGLEYQEIEKGIFSLTPYRPEFGMRKGPTWVADAIQKKVAKNYAGADKLNLLIYANFDAPQMNYADMVDACADLLHKFGSIWAITSLHICVLSAANENWPTGGWLQFRDPRDYQ